MKKPTEEEVLEHFASSGGEETCKALASALARTSIIVDKEELHLKVIHAACNYLGDKGVCKDADSYRSFCTNVCSYCDLVRAVNEWSR